MFCADGSEKTVKSTWKITDGVLMFNNTKGRKEFPIKGNGANFPYNF